MSPCAGTASRVYAEDWNIQCSIRQGLERTVQYMYCIRKGLKRRVQYTLETRSYSTAYARNQNVQYTEYSILRQGPEHIVHLRQGLVHRYSTTHTRDKTGMRVAQW